MKMHICTTMVSIHTYNTVHNTRFQYTATEIPVTPTHMHCDLWRTQHKKQTLKEIHDSRTQWHTFTGLVSFQGLSRAWKCNRSMFIHSCHTSTHANHLHIVTVSKYILLISRFTPLLPVYIMICSRANAESLLSYELIMCDHKTATDTAANLAEQFDFWATTQLMVFQCMETY